MPRKKSWYPVQPRKTKPKVPDAIKKALSEKADQLIESKLKPEYLKPPPEDNDFNYISDIYSKWHQHYFYFCTTYTVRGENAIRPSFEDKFARLAKICPLVVLGFHGCYDSL
ncbi:hypothetical protein [Candidatus Parabeggiatoa sp. HSG14]|uniref:hypothetical protein n=1 Tax=Candidatus Parabeggiatoa sp. HSG14 TaxID=3055593 RepID=UPI0025A87C05|nr:hypothetical protein [Thiotrichales bacterium HSG14]